MEKITLRVVEAKTRDVSRGIARIDSRIMEKLGFAIGEAIAVEGEKKAVAKLWPGYPEDEGKEIIRIDGNTRRNASVGIDDRVAIYKVEAKPARSITLAPTEPLRIVGGENYLAQIMVERIVTRGGCSRDQHCGKKDRFCCHGHPAGRCGDNKHEHTDPS